MILISKEDFTSNHMIYLDEFALCTHEEADTMIVVHTNHEAEGVLMAKVSDTEFFFIAISMMSAL